MTIHISTTIDIQDIVDQLDHESAEKLILAADAAMADYDFTIDLVKKLIAALRDECAADGETLDMRQFES
jgi:hypothetical protein